MGKRDSRKKTDRGRTERFLTAVLSVGIVLFSMTGCASYEEEEDTIVVIDQGEDESVYTLTEVVVGDVVKTASIRFSYSQVQAENVRYPVDGKLAEEVYVEVGDRVKKGQLLAILEGGNHEDEIRQLEYQIARLNLQLGYLDINEVYERSGRWWRYAYQSSGSDADEENLKSDLENMEQKYRYQREDYQDQIDMYSARLENYQKEMEESRIYATADGVITKTADLFSTISDVNKVAFVIMDDSVCVFEALASDYAGYFEEGDVVELVEGNGEAARVYQAAPWNMESWGTRMYMVLLNDEDMENIKQNMSAYVTLELEKRENVLALPKDAIRTSDEGPYVYVLGENDIREIKWIETGLYGDKMTEIVGGLEEGDVVILR